MFWKIIPMTTAPLGMGLLIWTLCLMVCPLMSISDLMMPQGDDRFIKFLIGLSPSMLQRGYIVIWAVLIFHRKGPSRLRSCELCAGVAGTEALKILLGRRDGYAPYGCHFDAYRHKMKMTWRPLGKWNIFQVILFFLLKGWSLKWKRHL